MTLIALPAFSDHTIWMLHDGREAYGVPAGAALVQTAPDAHGLALAAILVSRHGPHRTARRMVRHASPHITPKERPVHSLARRAALPDESAAQAAQKCTSAARPLQWKNRIR
jgi:hypothetical protein